LADHSSQPVKSGPRKRGRRASNSTPAVPV
jgi:hypothetical protein